MIEINMPPLVMDVVNETFYFKDKLQTFTLTAVLTLLLLFLLLIIIIL